MTIYDIAREAKTSISTVSRYLNNKNVQPETAQRIKEVIEKYNFKPSMIAQGLVSKSMKSIAIALVDIRISHYAKLAFMIEQAFAGKNYNIIISNFSEDIEKNLSNLNDLVSRNIDGIVFIGSAFEQLNNYPEELEILGRVPVVLENSILPLENSSSIMLDDYDGICTAVKYLIKKGRKNIFYVQDTNNASGVRKKNGFKDSVKKIYSNPEEHMKIAERTPDGGNICLRKIYQEHPEVDAVIFEEEITGIGGIKACFDLNLKAGKDIDIIGYNNSEYAEVCIPRMTVVDSMIELQGNKIIEHMSKMLNNESVEKIVVIKPELLIKESA